MSVINKVLRDLDQRQTGLRAAPSPADAALRSGTSSVESTARPARVSPPPQRRNRAVPAALVGLLVLAIAGFGLWQSGAIDTSRAPAVTATPKPPGAPMPLQSEPVAEVAATASAGLPANRFESKMVLPATPQNTPQKDNPPQRALTPATAAPVPVAATLPAQPPQAIAASRPAPVPIASVPASDAESAQKQQQAVRDALAQAQSLWNAGSHDAAIDLLQQAVASTERSASNAPAALANLVLLVRDLGRMQLGEGRPGAVWDTLTRLEPLLRNEPEMWALRANAAQRLGHHQDSVHAYMTALQSRPSEQRWLLGAAVSLAALGQITSAADMADKARAVGPISKEVQAYLRQMGVPINE